MIRRPLRSQAATGGIPRLWAPLVGAGLLVLVPSCGAGDPVQASGPEQPVLLAASGEASLLELLAQAPDAVPHEGVRLVEIYDVDGSGTVTPLTYREEIAVDGQGGFSLTPLSVESSVLPDPSTFMLMQEARSGYLFRYRDFRIRDFELLVQNYHLVAIAAEPQVIAGRTAEFLSFAHASGQGPNFEVWVDPLTGLALSIEVFDEDGQLLQRTAYESYVDGPPASFEPDRSANDEVQADLSQPLAEQLGMQPVLATIVPDGYELAEVATVVDGFGATWCKSTYTDGIDVLFLLGRVGSVVPNQPTPTFADSGSAGAEEKDRLRGYRAGRILILDGEYGDLRRIAVGTLPADELQAFLESSL